MKTIKKEEKAEQIFSESANRNMGHWSLGHFKKTHPTLFKTILEAMIDYSDQKQISVSDEDIYKCTLEGGKDKCYYKNKNFISCVALRKCKHAKTVQI